MTLRISETKTNEHTLIYDGNDLTQLFYESKTAGYEPQVRCTGCIVSDLYFKLYINKKSIRYRIKTQNLVTSSVDGTITVRTEQIYDNRSKAMYEFNKALFNPLHKSYYNETDIRILKDVPNNTSRRRTKQILQGLQPKNREIRQIRIYDRNNHRNRCKNMFF